MSYIVTKLKSADEIYSNEKLGRFVIARANAINEKYEFKFNGWWDFPFEEYLSRGNLILVCWKGDEPVGILAATLTNNLITGKKMLFQDHLSSVSPKATYLLLKEFIDFGKRNAKTIITCVGKNTNLKPKSLEKLGFEYMETLYSLEE